MNFCAHEIQEIKFFINLKSIIRQKHVCCIHAGRISCFYVQNVCFLYVQETNIYLQEFSSFFLEFNFYLLHLNLYVPCCSMFPTIFSELQILYLGSSCSKVSLRIFPKFSEVSEYFLWLKYQFWTFLELFYLRN